MKLYSIVSLAGLTLALSLSSCGQLPPEKAAEMARQQTGGGNSDNTQVSNLVVRSLLWDSKGNTDLKYAVTFNSNSRAFNIVLARFMTVPNQRVITLAAADQIELYSKLLNFFGGKVAVSTGSSNPRYTEARLNVDRFNNTPLEFAFPNCLVSLDETQVNLFDALNDFILSH